MTDEQLDVRLKLENKTEATFTLTQSWGAGLWRNRQPAFEDLIVNLKSVILREIKNRRAQIGPCFTSTIRRDNNYSSEEVKCKRAQIARIQWMLHWVYQDQNLIEIEEL